MAINAGEPRTKRLRRTVVCICFNLLSSSFGCLCTFLKKRRTVTRKYIYFLGSGQRAASSGQRTADSTKRTAPHGGQQTACCLLPAAYCLLPCCLLPTAYCLLPAA